MSNNSGETFVFGGLWWILFILVKTAGTSLATWSWAWIVFPIVIIQKLGWTL